MGQTKHNRSSGRVFARLVATLVVAFALVSSSCDADQAEEQGPASQLHVEGLAQGFDFDGGKAWVDAMVFAQVGSTKTIGVAATDSEGRFSLELPAIPVEGAIVMLVVLNPDDPFEALPLLSLAEVHGGSIALSLPGSAGTTPGGSEVELSAATTAATLMYGFDQDLASFIEDVGETVADLPLDSEEDFILAVGDAASSRTHERWTPLSASYPKPRDGQLSSLTDCLCSEARNVQLMAVNAVLSNPTVNNAGQTIVGWPGKIICALGARSKANELQPGAYSFDSKVPVSTCTLSAVGDFLERCGVGNCQEHAWATARRAYDHCMDEGIQQIAIVRAGSGYFKGHAFTLVSTWPKSQLDLTTIRQQNFDGTWRLGRETAEGWKDLLPEEQASLYYVDSWALQGKTTVEPCGAYPPDYLKHFDLDAISSTREIVLPTESSDKYPEPKDTDSCQPPEHPASSSFEPAPCQSCSCICAKHVGTWHFTVSTATAQFGAGASTSCGLSAKAGFTATKQPDGAFLLAMAPITPLASFGYDGTVSKPCHYTYSDGSLGEGSPASCENGVLSFTTNVSEITGTCNDTVVEGTFVMNIDNGDITWHQEGVLTATLQ